MTDCPREAEVLDAITAGRWPDGCGDALRAHTASCAICGTLASVATAIAEDAADAMRRAPIPTSGAVWWRMQRRMQMEAAQKASRAITFVELATLAATICAVLFLLGGLSLLKIEWHALPLSMPMAAAAGMLLLSVPVAVYYAIAD